MKAQNLINEIKFEEEPQNCNANEVINASNIETYDWYNKFYPTFN